MGGEGRSGRGLTHLAAMSDFSVDSIDCRDSRELSAQRNEGRGRTSPSAMARALSARAWSSTLFLSAASSNS